jgi:hypothetical protein
MVLCMLWTEWSVPSLKHLLSFLHRIASSLYWDLVSYFNSAAFSNSYSQYCSLTKYVCEIKFVCKTSSFTSFLVVWVIKNMHFRWCTASLLQCSQRLVCFRHWRNLVTWPFLLQQTLHLRSWIQQYSHDYCKERHALQVSALFRNMSWKITGRIRCVWSYINTWKIY